MSKEQVLNWARSKSEWCKNKGHLAGNWIHDSSHEVTCQIAFILIEEHERVKQLEAELREARQQTYEECAKIASEVRHEGFGTNFRRAAAEIQTRIIARAKEMK